MTGTIDHKPTKFGLFFVSPNWCSYLETPHVRMSRRRVKDATNFKPLKFMLWKRHLPGYLHGRKIYRWGGPVTDRIKMRKWGWI